MRARAKRWKRRGGRVSGTMLIVQPCVLRSDHRVVQPRRYRMRQRHLPVLILQQDAIRPLQNSWRAAAIARVRYREGAADFLALLDAERTELQAEDAVAEAEAGVFTSVIAVYKALGGIPAS